MWIRLESSVVQDAVVVIPDENPTHGATPPPLELAALTPGSWREYKHSLYEGGTILDVATLPILEYKKEIVETILANPVTVIRSPTGSGKTTEIPVMLLEAGIETVVVTQPRVIGAYGPAMWVAKQLGEDLGQTVGFKSSKLEVTGADTKIFYFTDGLELAREMLSRTLPGGVLIIDEAHEMNINQTILMALARHYAAQGNYRVVISSATMPVEIFSGYFDDAPIVDVRMKKYPLVEVPGKGTTADMAEKFLAAGCRSVLVFEAGEAEIEKTIIELQKRQVGAIILPVHSKLSQTEMNRCFQAYDKPVCYVGTNVVQTSVTLPNLDAVVDSGFAKYPVFEGGVEGLQIREISLAEKIQRMGRANRLGPGMYTYLGPSKESEMAPYPVPEIQREPLESIILKMKKAGLDVRLGRLGKIEIDMSSPDFFRPVELDLLHEMPAENVAEANNLLRRLRMIEDSGRLREIGHKVALLPVSPRMGRMIAHAESLEKTLPGILMDSLTISAIIEEQGIVAHRSKKWRKFCQKEQDSDIIAQLLCFRAAQNIPEKNLRTFGLLPRNIERAKERIETLLERKKMKASEGGDLTHPLYRRAILECILIAYEDHIYERKGLTYQQNHEGPQRVLPNDSVVVNPVLVVGIPFDLDVTRGDGHPAEIPFLMMPSRIDVDLVKAVCPHMLSKISARVKNKKEKVRHGYTHGKAHRPDSSR